MIVIYLVLRLTSLFEKILGAGGLQILKKVFGVILLFVVSLYPADFSSRCLPEISTTPNPPGPGFPLEAPSVYIVISLCMMQDYTCIGNEKLYCN